MLGRIDNVMTVDVKSLLAAAADYSRFLDAYGFVRRMITKSQVAILFYHRVSPKQDPWSLEPLSPQSFEWQMRYFCRNYEVIPLDRLVECITQGKPLPEKAVVITFDDGYKDNYRYAYPILKKCHVPATIFLTTGHIGTNNLFWWDKVGYIIQHTEVKHLYLDEFGSFSLQSEIDKFQSSSMIVEKLKKLPGEKKDLLIEKLLNISGVEMPVDLGKGLILSWDEIKEMSCCNGIAFGAHTVNHPILANLPLEQAKQEILQSKKDIEKNLGRDVTAFSYPNGTFADFNVEIVELVRECGFTCAVAVSPNKLVSPSDDIYELSRISVGENFSKSKFVICGLWADLHV